jgi:uncharacterized membrane protein YcaP (DUF421 family)
LAAEGPRGYTIDELAAAAPRQGIASFDAVAWAVLETGGRISVIRNRG